MIIHHSKKFMKQLLVPTDFSPCAGNALDFAVHSAKLLPAEITLLHAFEVTGDRYTDYRGVNKEFNQSLMYDVAGKLLQLKRSIEETEGLAVTTEIFKGTVNEAILHTAAIKNTDLVVMGTVGASGLKETLWGSKTAGIIGNSKYPVMVIPASYKWKKPEKLLIADNRFDNDAALLDFIFELADLYMAQVQVAVFTDEDDDKAITFLEHARKTPQYEKILRQQYNEEALTATHLYGTVFEETLQQYIMEKQIDVLVMVNYQNDNSFWDRLFHPSKTKKMSYHTKIPLLAIPGKNK